MSQATGIVCGFSKVDTGPHYSDITHGFFIEVDKARVIESSVYKTSFFQVNPASTFKVQRIQGVVTYYIDDALVYTSTVMLDGPVFLDCSLYAYGDSIYDATFFSLDAETSEAHLALLPLQAQGEEGDIALGNVILSPLLSTGEEDTTISVALTLSPLQALGTENDENILRADTSPLTSWGQVDWLVPDISSGHAQLSSLTGGGIELGAQPEAHLSLSPMQALGVEGDVNFGEAMFEPLEAELYMGQSNYLSAALPSWTASIMTGSWLMGSFPMLAGGLSAKQTGVSIHADMPSITGDLFTGAVIADDMPMLTGEMTAQAERSGSVEAIMPMLTGQMFSGTSFVGTMPSLEGTISAQAERTASVSAAMPSLTGWLDGWTEIVGDITADMPMLTGTVSGYREGSASISAHMPQLSGNMGVLIEETSSITGTLPILSGSLTAGRTTPHDLTATMPALTGFLVASRPAAWGVMRYSKGAYR